MNKIWEGKNELLFYLPVNPNFGAKLAYENRG